MPTNVLSFATKKRLQQEEIDQIDTRYPGADNTPRQNNISELVLTILGDIPSEKRGMNDQRYSIKNLSFDEFSMVASRLGGIMEATEIQRLYSVACRILNDGAPVREARDASYLNG